jgi:hypothetical protein
MPQVFKIIALELNCSYSLSPSKDGFFGNPHDDGSWTGLIGELQRGELDFTISDLAVTFERAQVRLRHHLYMPTYYKNNLNNV